MKTQTLLLLITLFSTSSAFAGVNLLCDNERNDSRSYVSISEGPKSKAFIDLDDVGSLSVPQKAVQPILDGELSEMDGVVIKVKEKLITFTVEGRFNKIRGMSLKISVVEGEDSLLELNSCRIVREGTATL